MVDLNRKIRATQARQGGFSSHVLPEPVPYSSAYPTIVVYYTAEGVATTAANASVQYFVGRGGVYGVTNFQGVNAFAPTSHPDPQGEFLVNVPSGFPIGTDDFTFEAWGEVGSLIDNGLQISLYFLNESNSVTFLLSVSLSIGTTFRRFVEWNKYIAPFASGNNQSTFSSSTPIPTTHMAAQRIGSDIIFHLNGQVVDYNIVAGSASNYDLPESLVISGLVDHQEGTAFLGQIRLTRGTALYGSGTFTPPSEPFFTP
jgi:hypothetical protein